VSASVSVTIVRIAAAVTNWEAVSADTDEAVADLKKVSYRY
jgi:hypothetical protein